MALSNLGDEKFLHFLVVQKFVLCFGGFIFVEFLFNIVEFVIFVAIVKIIDNDHTTFCPYLPNTSWDSQHKPFLVLVFFL